MHESCCFEPLLSSVSFSGALGLLQRLPCPAAALPAAAHCVRSGSLLCCQQGDLLPVFHDLLLEFYCWVLTFRAFKELAFHVPIEAHCRQANGIFLLQIGAFGEGRDGARCLTENSPDAPHCPAQAANTSSRWAPGGAAGRPRPHSPPLSMVLQPLSRVLPGGPAGDNTALEMNGSSLRALCSLKEAAAPTHIHDASSPPLPCAVGA